MRTRIFGTPWEAPRATLTAEEVQQMEQECGLGIGDGGPPDRRATPAESVYFGLPPRIDHAYWFGSPTMVLYTMENAADWLFPAEFLEEFLKHDLYAERQHASDKYRTLFGYLPRCDKRLTFGGDEPITLEARALGAYFHRSTRTAVLRPTLGLLTEADGVQYQAIIGFGVADIYRFSTLHVDDKPVFPPNYRIEKQNQERKFFCDVPIDPRNP
jgi:hypothetical protein